MVPLAAGADRVHAAWKSTQVRNQDLRDGNAFFASEGRRAGETRAVLVMVITRAARHPVSAFGLGQASAERRPGQDRYLRIAIPQTRRRALTAGCADAASPRRTAPCQKAELRTA